jgi:hypothetical protein
VNITDTDIVVADALYEKFARVPRFQVPKDVGIITATNEYMFGLFQLLYYSLHFSSDAELTVFDLFLPDKHREWCLKQDSLNLISITDDDLIFPRERDKRFWPTWNKPIYFLKSKYQKNLWIDADCVVFDNIATLLNRINDGPVIFKCEFGSVDKDISKLHRYLKTNIIPHQVGPPHLNAGIIGLDRERDSAILEKWTYVIQQATKDKAVQKVTPWYDQGGLQWTMEMLNMLEIISPETTWNHDRINLPNPESPLTFIQNLNRNECKLAHFAGNAKRGIKWIGVPIDIKSFDLCLDFFTVCTPDNRVNAKFRNEEEAIRYAEMMGYKVV